MRVNDTTTCWQTVGEKLARIETNSIFRQQFANMLLALRQRADLFKANISANKISLPQARATQKEKDCSVISKLIKQRENFVLLTVRLCNR